MSRPTESRLAESLEQLTDIAAEAGLDPAAARDEGLRVAAALAESVPGAAAHWARVADPRLTELGRINEAFFDAASRGRRWRGAPTDLLEALIVSRHTLAAEYAEALTEVASSAVMLGTAPIDAIAKATATSATYLAAVRPGAPGTLVQAGPDDPGSGPSWSGSWSGILPPLPEGPGTDAVLRSWGLTRVPSSPGDPAEGPGGATPEVGDGIRQQETGPTAIPAATQGEPSHPTEPSAEPAEPEKSVEELLAELDAMIGLARVKREIHRQVALLSVERMRTEAGLRAPKMSRHLIFVGNPGTGKTTVARLVGGIYRALGLLPKGQLVEVDRSELVAGYVGQTAMKTADVVANAVGGVLFIDEAYGLTGDQYAQEAVNTLVKEMEDHREDLVVIVAGYPEPMVGFIAQNPGLASRFTTTIEFDDYSDDELLAILDSIATGSDYELTDDARRRVRHQLEATPRTPAFGNGRFSRNLFEHAVGRHAWRLKDAKEPSRDDLRLLTGDDFTEQPDEPEQPDHLDAPDATDAPAAQPQDPADVRGDVRAEVRADPDGSAGTDEAVSDAQDEPHDPSANEHEDTA
ncbi:AAA family ATPase [Terrabacter sp. 2YAF2]|uniref:AAA family ATPase n=1 Tax=Terrabacter sp. 2YAF2 TaxID=3233026 RepID=UPI003F981E0D